MKRRLTTLLALSVVLVLGLALIRWTTKTTPKHDLPPAPAPASGAPDMRLAFLGADTDPWCKEVEGELAAFCREQGWRYTAYDCRGSRDIQARQVGELLRAGGADIAVLYTAMTPEDESAREEWVKTLCDGGCRVVTLGKKTGEESQAVCHIGVTEEALLTAAADFFQDSAGGVLLMPDVSQDARTEAALTVFPQKGLPIAEMGSTWGSVDFARDYVTGALERHPQVEGVVTFSRTGVLGAAEALADRAGVKILCLTYSPALKNEMEQGRLDAALTPSTQEAVEALQKALPKVAKGERPGDTELKVECVTPSPQP